MPTRFGIILDLLIEVFRNPASEEDYHAIVDLLRSYALARDSSYAEYVELLEHNYPLNYDPCDHMENIRKFMTFGSTDNWRVKELLEKYPTVLRS
jgi:hypothetical protein